MGVLLDDNGNIYASNTWSDDDTLKPEVIVGLPNGRYDKGYGAKVLVFSPEGTILRTIGEGWGTEAGKMIQPGLITFNENASLLGVQNKNGLDVL